MTEPKLHRIAVGEPDRTLKVCTACGVEKSLDAFPKNPNGGLGRRSRCRACHQPAVIQERGTERNTGRRKLISALGLPRDTYPTLHAQQAGRCAICARPKKLVIDHDHGSGHVRGLLCLNCNSGLGLLGDDVERVRAALQYLERSHG